MSGRCKSALAVVLALACMAAGATLASAGRLSLSSTTFRVTWTEMRVTASVEGFEESAICPVTLAGTFHSRTLAKTGDLLVATLRPEGLTGVGLCRKGAATILTASLPWHVRYESFTGTLPSISSLAFKIIGMNYAWEISFGFTCLYVATAEAPARWIATVERGAITRVRWDETRRLTSPSCPGTGIFSGSGTMTQQNSAALLTVTLI